MRGFKLAIFGIRTISLDARTVNVFVLLQFERIFIPISTFTHSGIVSEGACTPMFPPTFTFHLESHMHLIVCDTVRSLRISFNISRVSPYSSLIIPVHLAKCICVPLCSAGLSPKGFLPPNFIRGLSLLVHYTARSIVYFLVNFRCISSRFPCFPRCVALYVTSCVPCLVPQCYPLTRRNLGRV